MSTSDDLMPSNLIYSKVGDVYWIETELGITFYNSSTKLICLPSIINITLTDLEFVINELRKVEFLVKGINSNN